MALGADITMTPAVIQRQTNGMYVPSGQTLAIDGTLEIGGTAVTATAAEINAIAGGGLSAAELGTLDGVTAGTATASKALVIGASKEIATITSATITTLTTGAITSVDASLGIDGLSAAQGGAIVLIGGTSSTSGNAGGAVTAAGGVGGATGIGGAVTLTGGASAGAGGTGGDVALASGAATGGTEGSVKVQTVATGKLGFFGVTPVVRQSAYTQTYSTADKTHAAPTQQTVTAVANVTGATENYAFQDSSATVTQAEYRVLAKTLYLLFGQILADIADTKQVVNSIVDDLQAYGLAQ